MRLRKLSRQKANSLLYPLFCPPLSVSIQSKKFVDRVLACVGARRWWAALSGRARVQRLAAAHLAGAPLAEALADASAYGLCARGRLALGPGASLSGVVEVPDARWLPSPAGLGDAAWWGAGNGGGGARPASPAAQAPPPSPPSPPSLSASSYGSAAGSRAASPGVGSGGAGTTSAATLRGRGGGRRKSGGGGQGAQEARPGTPPARRARGLPPPSALPPTSLPSIAALSLADRRSLIPADLLPRGALKLASRLPGGHEASLGVSAGNDYVDAASSSSRVPLVLTADLAARPREDGIQYRVGVHRVWAADEEDGGGGGDGGVAGSVGGGGGPSFEDSPRLLAPSSRKPPLRSVAHVQGAVAVEGEAVVWQGKKRRLAAGGRGGVSSGGGGGGGDGAGGGGGGSAWLGEPAAAPLLAATATATTTGAEADPLAGAVGADWVVDLDSASAVAGPGQRVGSARAATPPPPPTSPTASALQARLRAAASAAESARALVGRLDAALRAGSGGARGPPTKARPPRRPYLPGLGPPRLALSGAVGCLGRMPLPDDLLLIAAAPAAAAGPQRRGGSPPRLLPGSSHGGTRAPASSSPPRPPPIRTTGSMPAAPLPLQPRPPWWRPALPRALDADAWAPCVRDTALRVFASAGASLQLGTFSRPLADYTYASIRLDAGLTAPGGGGSGGSTAFASGRRPRGGGGAFALEGRGVWHALSASLCQQVVGPLRVRADARLALETAGRGAGGGGGGPNAFPGEAAAAAAAAAGPGPGGSGGAKGAAAAWGGTPGPPTPAPAPAAGSPQPRRRPGARPPSAAGTAREALREAATRGWAAARAARPALLETAYGLDCVLPGTEGSLRLVGWWSPARREGMVELRLL